MADDSANILNYNTNLNNATYVSLRLGKRLIQVLIETGASVSICTQNILPKSCVIVPISSNVKLKGVTGTDVPVIDTSHLNIQIGNRTYNHEVYVVPKLGNISFILGGDFISKHGCVIDCKNLLI